MKHFLNLLLACTISLLSCNNEGDEFFNNDGADILFVGNSLTYTNDMPEMVKQISRAVGKEISVQVYALPNLGLEDHWKEGLVRNLLRDREFEYVVFQQGPSSQEDGRTSLLKYGGEICDYAESRGVKPVFYMVWPALVYYNTFDGVITNYTNASIEHEALLAPVGVHWREYRNGQFALELYSSDDFHPSNAGSFLAALTIYHTLYPDVDISNLNYASFEKYVSQEFAFREMIELVMN